VASDVGITPVPAPPRTVFSPGWRLLTSIQKPWPVFLHHTANRHLGVALSDDFSVLVWVDAELAERVQRGRGDSGVIDLSAT
jgi:hypothetical protein